MWHLQKTQLMEKERDTGSKLPESTIDIYLVGEQIAYMGKSILDYVSNFFLLCLDFKMLEKTLLDSKVIIASSF